MDNGLYAKFATSKGEILVNLEFEKVPGTVGNFVGLAEGSLENSAKPAGTPYYDGLKFHRVIADFMIQGGCPQGTGTGNPGYKFDDEFHADLKHDKPGILAMANAGPATNGSQFYITHVPTPHLDNKHAVFGSVVEGQDVVNAVSQGDEITKIEIVRVGDAAEKFDAVGALEAFKASGEERKAREIEKRKEQLDSVSAGYEETGSGLRYKILEQGQGKKAAQGAQVSVHYEGRFLDGSVFDSSFQRKQPIEFTLGVGQVIPGWDEGIQLLQVGGKASFVIPPELAYGDRGAGGVIPPNAVLTFDVELVDVN